MSPFIDGAIAPMWLTVAATVIVSVTLSFTEGRAYSHEYDYRLLTLTIRAAPPHLARKNNPLYGHWRSRTGCVSGPANER